MLIMNMKHISLFGERDFSRNPLMLVARYKNSYVLTAKVTCRHVDTIGLFFQDVWRACHRDSHPGSVFILSRSASSTWSRRTECWPTIWCSTRFRAPRRPKRCTRSRGNWPALSEASAVPTVTTPMGRLLETAHLRWVLFSLVSLVVFCEWCWWGMLRIKQHFHVTGSWKYTCFFLN